MTARLTRGQLERKLRRAQRQRDQYREAGIRIAGKLMRTRIRLDEARRKLEPRRIEDADLPDRIAELEAERVEREQRRIHEAMAGTFPIVVVVQ